MLSKSYYFESNWGIRGGKDTRMSQIRSWRWKSVYWFCSQYWRPFSHRASILPLSCLHRKSGSHGSIGVDLKTLFLYWRSHQQYLFTFLVQDPATDAYLQYPVPLLKVRQVALLTQGALSSTHCRAARDQRYVSQWTKEQFTIHAVKNYLQLNREPSFFFTYSISNDMIIIKCLTHMHITHLITSSSPQTTRRGSQDSPPNLHPHSEIVHRTYLPNYPKLLEISQWSQGSRMGWWTEMSIDEDNKARLSPCQ